MKKTLALFLSVAMLLTSFALTVSASTDRYAPSNSNTDLFENKTEATIVYLGGSITQGAGASSESNKWASQVTDYMKNTYGGTSFVHVNKGLGGTGSGIGLLRLQQDVVSCNPDVVFIEFAVNDNDASDAPTLRNLESIILSLQSLNKVPDIAFILTTNKTLNIKETRHIQVADYYNIPYVNLQEILTNDTQTDPTSLFSGSETVHPNEAGHNYYANAITGQIALDPTFFRKPEVKSTKIRENSKIVRGFHNLIKNTTVSAGWTQPPIGDRRYSPYYTTTNANETIEFNFTGSVFAIRDYILTNGGRYTVEVDGETVNTRNSAAGSSQRSIGYGTVDLSSGNHTAKITTLDSGKEVRIEYLVTEPTDKIILEAETPTTSSDPISFYSSSTGNKLKLSYERASASGEKVIGFNQGAWISYDVDIKTAGKYTAYVVGCVNDSNGGEITTTVDSAQAKEAVLPNTGNWEIHENSSTVEIGSFDMTKGTRSLKVVMDKGVWSFDYIYLVRTGNLTTIPTIRLEAETPDFAEPDVKVYNKSVASGGKIIGINENAYISYNVDIAQTGNYKITGAGCSVFDSPFRVFVDGMETFTGTLNATGSWNIETNYGSNTIGNFDVLEGSHTIKFLATPGCSYSLDYFDIEYVGPVTGTYEGQNYKFEAESPSASSMPVNSSGSNVTAFRTYNQSYDGTSATVLGFTGDGRWIEFKIPVWVDGDYTIKVKGAIGDATTVPMYMDGELINTANVAATPQSGYEPLKVTEPADMGTYSLISGMHTLRLVVGTGCAWTMDYITIDYVDDTGVKMELYNGSTPLKTLSFGTFTPKVNFKGNLQDAQPYFMAVLYKDGKVASVVSDLTLPTFGDIASLSDLSIEDDHITSVYKVKLFLWDELSTMNPYIPQKEYELTAE